MIEIISEVEILATLGTVGLVFLAFALLGTLAELLGRWRA